MLHVLVVPAVKASVIRSELVHKTIFFPLPLTVSRENLKRAVLLVYVYTPDGDAGQQTQLRVQSNRLTKKNMLYSKKVGLEPRGRWHHIDITHECETWLKNEWSNNLGIVATAKYNGVDLIGYENTKAVNNDTIDRVSKH